ncbi:MAG: hypothetical protein Fur0022_06310 [Anaerolineales bacterium]
MFHPFRSRLLLVCWWGGLLAFAGGILFVQTARAHTRVEAGPYVIVVGWEQEPVIVGERNAVWLEILEGDLPVTEDVKVDLEATVFYGGHSFLGFPAPAEKAGLFLMDMFPTVRGVYELQLIGTIGETPVDLLVELDEVQPASALQFPENQPDPLVLQTQLEETQAQLRTANLLAMAGLVTGLLGLGVGVTALIRRTKT